MEPTSNIAPQVKLKMQGDTDQYVNPGYFGENKNPKHFHGSLPTREISNAIRRDETYNCRCS